MTIGSSVTNIEEDAFKGCSNVKTLIYAEGTITTCRTNLNSIISVSIPYSVTSIGEYTFYKCSGLTSVTIPNSVTSIGNSAFSYCSGLTSITIPNSVTGIGGWAFWSCSSLTSVTIPNSVTYIGSHAFKGCSGLTSVTIPNSVTSIGESAFEDCSSLTSVTIPNFVTYIGYKTFQNCSKLTSIIIGNSVARIRELAFYNSPIEKIYCLAISPPSCDNSAFTNYVYVTGRLYVPRELVHDYEEDPFWKQFGHALPLDPSTTEIPTITSLSTGHTYYNLQGQRSATPARGIYIVSGKKRITQ